MIVSAIDGRIRYVDSILQKKVVADALVVCLQELRIVSCVQVKKKTGSLLVLFEGNKNNQRTIVNVIKQQIKKHRGRPKNRGSLSGRRARKVVKFIMIGTITGSMAVLFAGSEKWHYRIGTAFLSALGLHLIQNRRTLLR